MAMRVIWVAGPSGTTVYQLTSGSTASGTFYPLATVPHSLTGSDYDPVAGLFFWDDLSGTRETWYAVTASDGAIALAESYTFSVGYSTYPVRNPIPPPTDAEYDPPPPPPIVYTQNDAPPPPIGWATQE